MTSEQRAASVLPLYRRIHDDLKAAIESGRYQEGDRLPSEAELSQQYGVSRITSRQALDLLCSQGLLVRRQGMGSFVAASRVNQPLVRLTDFMEDMAEAGLRAESRVLAFEEERARPEVVTRLAVPERSPVMRLDRLRLADGSPIALDSTWLPPHIAKVLAGEDLASQTIYGILEGKYGIPVVSGEYIIRAGVSILSQAVPLDISPGHPLLVFDRTSFTTGDKPVYFQRRWYRADRVEYRLTLGRASSGASAIETFTPVFEAGERR